MHRVRGRGDRAQQVGSSVRRNGTYVVDAGGSWSAASTDLDPGQATQLIDDASQGRADDAAGTLGAFVSSVADTRPAPTGDDGGGSGGPSAG